MINEKGRIEYINPAFTQQWGYEIDELKEYSVLEDSDLKKGGIQNSIRKVFESKNIDQILTRCLFNSF